jgi:hypothetical protein
MKAIHNLPQMIHLIGLRYDRKLPKNGIIGKLLSIWPAGQASFRKAGFTDKRRFSGGGKQDVRGTDEIPPPKFPWQSAG